MAANCSPLSSRCPSSHPSPVYHTPFTCCPSSSPRQPPPHHSPCHSHSPPHATSPSPHAPLPTVPPVLPASPAPAAFPTAAAPKPAGTQGAASATATAEGAVLAPQARPSAMPSPPSPAPSPLPSALAAVPRTDVTGHWCSRMASGHGALHMACSSALAGSAVGRGSTGCAGASEHAGRCAAEEGSVELHHSRAAHLCCPPQPARMHHRLAPQHTAAPPGGKVPLTPPASETPSLTPPTPQPASLPTPSPHPSPLPSPPNLPAHPPPPAPPSWKHLAPPEWHAAPYGASLAMVQAGGSDVRIWDVRDGGVAVSMQTEGAVERMASCSPILWLDEERLVVVEEGGSVGLWHVAGGEAVLFHHVQLLDPWGEAERVCAVAVMPGRRCNKRLFSSLRGEGVTCAVASESAVYLADWSTPAVILHRIASSHARPPDAMCFAGTSLFVALPSLPHEDFAAVQVPTRPSLPPPVRTALQRIECISGREGERYHLDSHVPRASRGPLLAVRVHAGRLFALHAGGVHVFRLHRAAQRGGGAGAGRGAGGDGGYEVRGRGYLQQRAGQGRRGRDRCGSAMAGMAAATTQAPVQRAVECGATVTGRESGGAEKEAAVVLRPQAWHSGAAEGSEGSPGNEGQQGRESGYGREEGYETEEGVDGQEGEGGQDGIARAVECDSGGGGDGGGVGSGGSEGVEERRLVGVVGRRVNGLLHPAMDVVGDRLLLVSANHPPCLYSCP
ncbi:unnamed protein product [Closterium sp. NIES-65]|nr:unnamed protein product [Closterium sp. NIES-65]